MWCVAELGLPFARQDIGHEHGGLGTPEFGALNPNRTVPVLRDEGGDPIWETGAILRYLAASYGDEDFWSPEPAARAQVDKWAEWAKLNVAMAFTVPVFWRVVRTAPQDRDDVAIRAAVQDLERKLAIADRQLGKTPNLAGAKFTLADIQLGHILFRYYDIAIERANLNHLRRYYHDLCQRPAYREHVMISYDVLRVSNSTIRNT